MKRRDASYRERRRERASSRAACMMPPVSADAVHLAGRTAAGVRPVCTARFAGERLVWRRLIHDEPGPRGRLPATGANEPIECRTAPSAPPIGNKSFKIKKKKNKVKTPNGRTTLMLFQ